MMIKPEQKMGMIFLVFSIAMGFLSNQIGGGTFAFLIPIALYVGMIFGLKRVFIGKKGKWLVTNSILTFLLIWLLSWIFILNTV